MHIPKSNTENVPAFQVCVCVWLPRFLLSGCSFLIGVGERNQHNYRFDD